MIPFPFCFSKLIISIFLMTAFAAQSAVSNQNPLLDHAKLALSASKHLVADVIETDMEMLDGDGLSMGKMLIQEKISAWSKGEPTRIIFSNNNPEYADVAKSRFKVVVDNHPDQGLNDGSSIEHSEPAIYIGKECVIFDLSGKRGNRQFTSKVWVEKASGLPLKMIHKYSGIPMMKSMTQTIIYGKNKEGNLVPLSSVVDTTVSMLFKQMRIVSKYRFSTWVSRPNNLDEV